ncbi:hypothetical protein SESBI_18294, partial [Sesbania bispinosa]
MRSDPKNDTFVQLVGEREEPLWNPYGGEDGELKWLNLRVPLRKTSSLLTLLLLFQETKEEEKNGKQLTWVLLIKSHRVVGCLASVAPTLFTLVSVVKHRVADA